MRYVAAAIVASHLGKQTERHAGPGDVESIDRPRAVRRLARGVLLAASALWKTTHSSA